jgi:hypothetical protein
VVRCWRPATLPIALTAVAVLAGCGGSSDSGARGAPSASQFPAVQGRSLEQILRSAAGPAPVVAPTSQVFRQGRNRYGFGVFEPSGRKLNDADVAIYIAHGPRGAVHGPFPASVESMATDAKFRSRTVANDPDAATVVYVTDVNLDAPGEWRVIALVRNGNTLEGTRLASAVVGAFPKVPPVGAKAPAIHTPTAADVGGHLEKIDTRQPHDDMHDADLADVVGRKPVVLLFATPALCQSRTCGPVVDQAEQVKQQYGDRVAFIHMEIYNDNDPNKGVRPQVRAYHLPSEPWLFVIDRDGRISSEIEGAFGLDELEAAVQKVAG